jgi:hypothetical protein
VGQEVVKTLHAYDEVTDVSQVQVGRSTLQLCLTNVKYCYSLFVDFCLVRVVHQFNFMFVRLNALQMATSGKRQKQLGLG